MGEWLANFVMQQASSETAGLVCSSCGLSYNEFRQRGLLGCAKCYQSFEKLLTPLIQRAQENAEHHVGKTPPEVDRSQRKQYELIDLKRKLRDTVAAEKYEEAAKIRDRIQELEGG